MIWKIVNGAHHLILDNKNIAELRKGAIITVKTKLGDLIVVKRE